MKFFLAIALLLAIVNATAVRTFQNKVRQSLARVLVGAGLLAPIAPALAANEASELFAKAYVAIKQNQDDYKSLENEWSSGRKTLDDTNKLLSNTQLSLAALSNQVAKFDATIDKLVNDDVQTLQQLQTEVNALQLSTGLKYKAAEDSASNPRSSASTTAQLFLKAQNEASTLAQDEKNLASLANAVGGTVQSNTDRQSSAGRYTHTLSSYSPVRCMM